MITKKINICVFGTYSKKNLRNRVLIKAIKSIKKYKITEINEEIPKFKDLSFFNYAYNVLKKMMILTKDLMKTRCNIIIIPYPGIFAVFLAKIFKKATIIFDPFISIYESNVFDYKTLKPESITAFFYFNIEKIAFRLANIIFSDTYMHKILFKKMFNLKKPIFRIFVGTDPSFLESFNYNIEEFTKKNKKSKFIVSYIGNYIPLHGLDFIIKSSEYLNDFSDKIVYEIIGGKMEQQAPFKDYCRLKGIKNIKFINPMPLNKLPEFIFHSHVQLGIFGLTPKTKRVIPTKAYVAIAAQKPLITANTQAIQEIFTHKENAYLCKAGDPKSLADAIIQLYKNDDLRQKISQNGYKLFNENCTPEQIGKKLERILAKIEMS